jgi:hypothetical protein
MTHDAPPLRIFTGSSSICHGKYKAIKWQVVGRENISRKAVPRLERSFSFTGVSLIKMPNKAIQAVPQPKKFWPLFA